MVLVLALAGCSNAMAESLTSAAEQCDWCPDAATAATTLWLPDGAVIDGGVSTSSDWRDGETAQFCTCVGATRGSGLFFVREISGCASASCEFRSFCNGGHHFDAGCPAALLQP